MAKGFREPFDQLDAALRTAQHLARLTTHQDLWTETGTLLIQFFGAEACAIAEAGGAGGLRTHHWMLASPEQALPALVTAASEAAAEVLGSGILAMRTQQVPEPWTLVGLPIPMENQKAAVLLVGHRGTAPFTRPQLNLYLAVAGLVGTAAVRLASERHLRANRQNLEDLVQARTAELTRTNQHLVREIEHHNQAQAALRKTNAYLESLINYANAPIIVWDPLFRITRFNRAFETLTGHLEADVLGQSLEILFPFERVPKSMALIRKTLTGERWEVVEIQILHKDGSVRTVLWNSATLFEADGRTPVATIAQGQDITDRKRAEEALRASEEKFVKAFHSAPILVALSRLEDGTLMEVNDRYCSALGFAREDLVGRTTLGLGIVLPEAREPLVQAIREQRSTQSIEFNMHAKNGQIIPCLFSGELIQVGGETLLISMLTEITELKQAERERQRLKTEVEHMQKLESLGRLAGGVAHDMNNVLGAILALSSAHLASLPKEHPLYASLETIRMAATRGGDMVKGLLTFSRQTPSERHELNLNTLLLEEARLLERTTLAKVHLELDLAPDLHPILGDGSALAHAFMNVCVNAVDALQEGGTLSFRTRNLGADQIEIALADNGCGMSREVLDRAMDPFFTTKAVGKGTGLGLSLVFTTVKAHGGHLEIQSEPDHGTRVIMTFPATQSQASQPGQAYPSGQVVEGQPMQVLLVDDDELIQESTRMLVEILGHVVTSASSGEGALSLLDQGFKPDAVILDMNMPGLGGQGTLPRLRHRCPTVPVLLATGRVDQDALDLIASQPFVTLMPKPFSYEELRDHLLQCGSPE